MVEMIDDVYCPIEKKQIDIGLCQDVQAVVDNAIKEDVIDFNISSDDRTICQNCKKRIDPAL